MSAHLSEWTLRRMLTGELAGPELVQNQGHVSSCAPCRERLAGLEAEQKDFEARVPFEPFARGVERGVDAARPERSGPQLNGFLVAAAAVVLIAVTVRPLLTPPEANRLKGGAAAAELRIGGAGAQRAVLPGDTETLLPGERVRLGYVAGANGYVLALSVDDRGEVSALYPESGHSLAVEPGGGRHWLPESQEFTGAGQERVVVVLSRRPLDVEAVRTAARKAWEAAGGKVAAMTTLDVEGEETHWLLRKP